MLFRPFQVFLANVLFSWEIDHDNNPLPSPLVENSTKYFWNLKKARCERHMLVIQYESLKPALYGEFTHNLCKSLRFRSWKKI